MLVIDKTNCNAVCRISPDGSAEAYDFPAAAWKPIPAVSDNLLEITDSDLQNLIRAFTLAEAVHKGQTDKAGKPYIAHPLRVAQLVDGGLDELMVAFLHDVVEDTSTSLDDLRKSGFSETVVNGVDCMTRRSGEPREAYLERLKPNPVARAVKLADLTHNSDLSRIPQPTEKDRLRVEEYRSETAFLKQ